MAVSENMRAQLGGFKKGCATPTMVSQCCTAESGYQSISDLHSHARIGCSIGHDSSPMWNEISSTQNLMTISEIDRVSAVVEYNGIKLDGPQAPQVTGP